MQILKMMGKSTANQTMKDLLMRMATENLRMTNSARLMVKYLRKVKKKPMVISSLMVRPIMK